MRYSRSCAVDEFGRRGCLSDSLEALAVDDGGSGFVVLGLGDPHGLEGGEGGEDGTYISN